MQEQNIPAHKAARQQLLMGRGSYAGLTPSLLKPSAALMGNRPAPSKEAANPLQNTPKR